MLRMYTTKVEFLSFLYTALILPTSKRKQGGGFLWWSQVRSKGQIRSKGLTCPQVA